MGWLAMIGLALLTGGALWKWGHLPRSAFEPVAAALLLGLAGYALQGRPFQPGSPVRPPAIASVADEPAIEARKQMGTGRFGDGPAWLAAADGAMRAGLPQAAVTYIRSGLREHPRDPDLWVGLGNALTVANKGRLAPAALFAFQRAADIAPAHPGPPFFTGLAYAQSGQFGEARAIWTELLERSPADAPWRADLQARLAELPS